MDEPENKIPHLHPKEHTAGDRRWWCKYYNGVAQNTLCNAEVPYSEVKTLRYGYTYQYTYPCFDRMAHTCEARTYYSDEEWEERERNQDELLGRIMEFTNKANTDCLRCGRPVVRLKKVRRWVIAEPCGCRLWQGSIPEEWL